MVAIWELDKVNECVDEISTTSIRKFYPTFVAKSTGLPLPLVFQRLMELNQVGKIHVKWEIRCPEYECVRTLKVIENKHDFPETVYCGRCGEEVEVTPDIIFPIFEVDLGYRDYMLQKKKRAIA